MNVIYADYWKTGLLPVGLYATLAVIPVAVTAAGYTGTGVGAGFLVLSLGFLLIFMTHGLHVPKPSGKVAGWTGCIKGEEYPFAKEGVDIICSE